MQLSRWLARRGCTVLHVYSQDIETPRGALMRKDDDPATFDVQGVSAGSALNKYNLVMRYVQEHRYARNLTELAKDFRPDIILSGNASPAIQKQVRLCARKFGSLFIYWLQDLYSIAFDSFMRKKLPLVGAGLGYMLRRLEFSQIANSDRVVAITNDFIPILTQGGVAASLIDVIENWASVDEIQEFDKRNAWSQENNLADKFVFMYSGTLGLKHNPELLATLAETYLTSDADVRVVVVSNGMGRKWLEKQKKNRKLRNLLLFDFLPYEQLPAVLATGDVLVCVLESAAGVMSVPSKVLSYLCAARPLLGAIPQENLAARLINNIGAGVVSAPDDIQSFVAKAQILREDHLQRMLCASNARIYAKETFDIDKVGEKFLKVFHSCL